MTELRPDPAAPRKTKRCPECDSEIPEHATKCKECGAQQGAVKPCVVCRQPIPEEALRCNACQVYQNRWLRHFPVSATAIALIAAFIGVVSAVLPAISYFRERDSHTRFKVTAAIPTRLYLKVWNTGRKPSVVIAHRLKFGDLSIETVPLDLSDEDKEAGTNVITSREPIRIGLWKPKLEIYKPGHKQKYQRAEIDKQFSTDKPVTLELDIQESNDPWTGFGRCTPPRPFHRRMETVPARLIHDFILGQLKADQS
jgi:hypothetical protein